MMRQKPPSPDHEPDSAARRQRVVDLAARALIETPEDLQFEVLQRMLEAYLRAFRRAYPDATEDERGANVLAYADAISQRKSEIEKGRSES